MIYDRDIFLFKQVNPPNGWWKFFAIKFKSLHQYPLTPQERYSVRTWKMAVNKQ